MKMNQFLTSAAIFAMLPMAASAATISWAPSENLYQGNTTQAFVDTSGTLAVAMNATDTTSPVTPLGGSVTVNGVAFQHGGSGDVITGVGGESITLATGDNNFGAFDDGEFSGDGAIFTLLRSGSFRLESVTLAGLTSGYTYQIQVFTNDARGNRHEFFQVGLTDGTSLDVADITGISDLNNSPVNGDPPVFPQTNAGDSIIGSFVANGSTQTFGVFGRDADGGTFTNGGTGASQINGIQLRITAIPEPSSAALLGLGGLALILRRRK
ncbi:hypothetical protein NT6N_08480 [Oceaniferula spumae]|uniref:Ice-binding protein C-terminal domain-containing protein n=1 Tax=Oceaniferula spumae TaxID=2979115 RepID=A0AAT9FIL0_9BACT